MILLGHLILNLSYIARSKNIDFISAFEDSGLETTSLQHAFAVVFHIIKLPLLYLSCIHPIVDL